MMMNQNAVSLIEYVHIMYICSLQDVPKINFVLMFVAFQWQLEHTWLTETMCVHTYVYTYV